MYGLLMMIVSLNARPLELSEDNIKNLSNRLFIYLVEAASVCDYSFYTLSWSISFGSWQPFILKKFLPSFNDFWQFFDFSICIYLWFYIFMLVDIPRMFYG